MITNVPSSKKRPARAKGLGYLRCRAPGNYFFFHKPSSSYSRNDYYENRDNKRKGASKDMLNSHVHYHFDFHNVGQGIFYTGQIENFVFVYDCGSRSVTSVRKAIDHWLSTHSGSRSTIDALVISHLDHDHVSGVDYLLARMPVKLVIMPYVSLVERILLALRATAMPDWYVSFIEDPVQYLLSTEKVLRIILVLPSGEENEQGRLADPFQETDFTDEQLEFRDELWPVLEPMLEDEKEETRQGWRKHLSSGRLVFRTHRGIVVLGAQWEFRFFVQEVDHSLLQNFRHCLRNLCHASTLQQILRCKNKRAQLRSCYKPIARGKKLNPTSLALFHGPLNRDTAITVKCSNKMVMHFCLSSCYRLRECSSCCLTTALSGPANGQLLTGDLDLSKNYDDFINHMGSRLQATAVCLLPHHGSALSWNPALKSEAKNCRLWVASAGINNKRNHHPSPAVIQDILRSGNAFFWVNELTGLSLVYR